MPETLALPAFAALQPESLAASGFQQLLIAAMFYALWHFYVETLAPCGFPRVT